MKSIIGNKWIIAFSLLIAILATTVCILVYLFVSISGGGNDDGYLDFEVVENGRYVLYIGLNDKNTYEQIIPTDEAVEIVDAICVKYVEGYTMAQVKGGWIDEFGALTQENTLVYTFTHIDEQAIIAIMDEVLIALNQNAILVENQRISSVYYRG